jgi:hypothetical protein
MSQRTNAVAVRTIGIDAGKNTFRLIGLDTGERLSCVRSSPGPDWQAASECIAVLDRDRGGYGDALCCRRVARTRS